ncbi:MAG: bifunctional diguanylate cyclase/phosphodiesterase [bacterium]
MPKNLHIAIVVTEPSQARNWTAKCESQGWQVSRFSIDDLVDTSERADIVIFDQLHALPAVNRYLAKHLSCNGVYVGVTRTDIGLPERCSVLLEKDADNQLVPHLATIANVAQFDAQFFQSVGVEPITQLPRHKELLQRIQAYSGQPCGLIVAEIDHAEHLYEHLDPVSKTDLLGAVGKLIASHLPDTAHPGIFNAACFVAWCPQLTGAALEQASQRLANACQDNLSIRGGELHFTISCGYADTEALNAPEQLWQAAWSAKETSKHKGGNQCTGALASGRLSQLIPEALERNEFSLALQPQWHISGAHLTGAEALLRWQGLDVGHITPDQFIPLAERRGEMNRMGDWVLKQICQNLWQWRSAGAGRLLIGINVSPQQFNKGAIARLLETLLKEHDIDASQLELELSHENLLHVVDQHRRTLFHLRDLGIRVAIDNLGVGVVDAKKLLRCPADTLKIDRTLLAKVEHQDIVRTLVAQICQIADRFDLRCVAVGVESDAQRILLENLGCSDAQGFLFSEPVALPKFSGYLADQALTKKTTKGVPG